MKTIRVSVPNDPALKDGPKTMLELMREVMLQKARDEGKMPIEDSPEAKKMLEELERL